MRTTPTLLREGQAVVGLLQPLIDPQLMADAGQARASPRSASTPSRARCRAPSRWTSSRRRPTSAATAPCSSPPRPIRPLLPAADDRRRHGPAGERAGPRHRRRRAPGDRHCPATGRDRQGIRRSLGDQGAGRVARRQVHRAQVVADASGTGGYARELTAEERAAQQNELNGHIAGMDVIITTAQVPGRRPPLLVTADGGQGHEVRLGHRRHGGQRAGRQRRAVEARRDDRDRQRRDDHRADQPAGHDARRREPVLRAQPVRVPAPLPEGRRAQHRHGRRDHRGHGHHPRRRRSSRKRPRSCSSRPPRRPTK